MTSNHFVLRLIGIFPKLLYQKDTSSTIRQKVESQNECFKEVPQF